MSLRLFAGDFFTFGTIGLAAALPGQMTGCNRGFYTQNNYFSETAESVEGLSEENVLFSCLIENVLYIR